MAGEGDGFTSRKAVLCSLGEPPGRRVATTIMETDPDGGRMWLVSLDRAALAAAVALHLERCGGPSFAIHGAHTADVAALDRASRAGLPPVPARAATLHAVGHVAPGVGRTPGTARGRDRP